MAKRRVLITGISRFLAGHLAQRLESDPDIEYLVGLDIEEPKVELERTEFVHVDVRNPLVSKVIEAAKVDTVVHLNVIAQPALLGGRAAMKETNVIGTMQLLAACQKAKRVRRVVVKSTTAVYGADARDPAVFTEDMGPHSSPSTGYGKDAVEVEGYARSLMRHRPDVALTLLRFANFIGASIETPLTRYFGLPVVPTALGFDPRLQFLHEEDAVEILVRAAREDHPGIYNAAGHGVLPLSQAVRLTGRPFLPVPLPFVNLAAGLMRRTRAVDFSPEQIRFLVYGRVVDCSRLKKEFGYTPRYSSLEAFRDFVAKRRIARLITPEKAARWEREVHEFLRRYGQEQGMSGAPETR
ncbi:MAG: NAD-dependent epimerase/dehydratase family protein [Actinomycetota bacterium]